MCFDHDSRPADRADRRRRARLAQLVADRRRRQPVRGVPGPRGRAATGAGVVILPDVRGLHPFYEELALRFAERGDRRPRDRLVRADRRRRRRATTGFEYMPHVEPDDLGRDLRPTSRAARRGRSARTSGRAARVFTVGFCMGGRLSFLAATLGLDLAGVIGLLRHARSGRGGTTRRRRSTVARRDRVHRSSACSAAPTRASRPRPIAAFDAASTRPASSTGIVTYPGAPHSFFDRKAADFAAASAAAWDEMLAFIGAARRGRPARIGTAGPSRRSAPRQRLASVQALATSDHEHHRPQQPVRERAITRIDDPAQPRADRVECPGDQTGDAVPDGPDEPHRMRRVWAGRQPRRTAPDPTPQPAGTTRAPRFRGATTRIRPGRSDVGGGGAERPLDPGDRPAPSRRTR